MGKKSANFFYHFFLPFFLLSIIIYILFTAFVCLKSYTAASTLTCMQTSHELMRIKIYGSSYSAEGSTVSASLSIIDSNGNEISAIERSWPGSYLGAEFARFRLYGKNFVFPVKVYGKNSVRENSTREQRGTRLEKYYNDYRQCMLLGHGSSYKDRALLYWLSVFSTKKYHLLQFSLVEYLNLDLSGCKSETYYSVICNEDGNLFVVEL